LFSSLSSGTHDLGLAIAAGGGDGASRLEAERHLLQTGGFTLDLLEEDEQALEGFGKG
jgi:hypothetical protein